MRSIAGFSLIEVMLALGLGLLLVLAGGRVFIGALQSWQAQEAAARMQEEARFVLQRMARDIRMAGAFGCLRPDTITFSGGGLRPLFSRPMTLQRRDNGNLVSLALVGAQAGDLGGEPDWTLITDCRTKAEVVSGRAAAGPGMFAMPLREQIYRLDDEGGLLLKSARSNANLIGGVERLEIEEAEGILTLSLTLTDPRKRVRNQTYRTAVALRNDPA